MKTLFKVFFVGFLFLIGIQLYSCSSQRAYQKELVKQGNLAYKEGDFSLFNEIFEYHLKEPYVKEKVTITGGDNRPYVNNKDISFELLVLLQAENEKSHLTVILYNLEIEDVSYSLDIVLKKDNGQKILEERLFRLSQNNWYIQYFEFDSDVIDKLLITHKGVSSVEPIILYNSLEVEGFEDYFIKKEDYDLIKAIKENNLEELNIIKREKDPFKGKGTGVIIVLVVYTIFALLLIYAVLIGKKEKNIDVYKKEESNNKV